MSIRTQLDKNDINKKIKETRLELNVYRAKRERLLLQAQLSSKQMRRKRDKCSFAMHDQFERLQRLTVVMYVAFVKKRRNEEGSYAPPRIVTIEAELLRAMHHTVVYQNQIICWTESTNVDERYFKKVLDQMTEKMTQTELKLMNLMCRIAAENEEMEKEWKKKLDESQKELDEARKAYQESRKHKQPDRSTLEMTRLAVAAEKEKIKEKLLNLPAFDGDSSVSSLEGSCSIKSSAESNEEESTPADEEDQESDPKENSRNSSGKTNTDMITSKSQKYSIEGKNDALSKAEEACLLHQLELVEELAEEDYRLTQATLRAVAVVAKEDEQADSVPTTRDTEENQKFPRAEPTVSAVEEARIMEEIQLAQEAAEQDSCLAEEAMEMIQDAEVRLGGLGPSNSSEEEPNWLDTVGAEEKALIESEMRLSEDLLLSEENGHEKPIPSKQEITNSSPTLQKVAVETSADLPTSDGEKGTTEGSKLLEEEQARKKEARRKAAEETRRYQEACLAEEETKLKKGKSQTEISPTAKSNESIDQDQVPKSQKSHLEEEETHDEIMDEDDIEAVLMAEAKKRAQKRKAKRQNSTSTSPLTIGSEDSMLIRKLKKSQERNSVISNSSDLKSFVKEREEQECPALIDHRPYEKDGEDETAPTSSLEDDLDLERESMTEPSTEIQNAKNAPTTKQGDTVPMDKIRA